MSNVRKVHKKCRDDCVITVSVPKKLIKEYVEEPVCFNQPRSNVHRYVDYLFHIAVWNAYIKLKAESDSDGWRD